MNRPSDNERLFADALADTAPAGFRDALMSDALRQARLRRQFRRARKIETVLAIVALLSILFWPKTSQHHGSIAESPAASYQLISTQPLPAGSIVVTRPFINQIAISTEVVSIITTAQSHDQIRELTDDELLSLAPAPALLVRLGPHSAELVLGNQEKSDLQ